MAVPMNVTVRLFAAYREAFEQSELALSIPVGTTVQQVQQLLIQRKPQLSRWQDQTRYGVNQAFVDPQTIIQAGDEIVFIPPVSGG
jgi:molybdopterin synthase sulfur carrier subunit